jgi:hypothetical protein
VHLLQIFVFSEVLNWTPRPHGLEGPHVSRGEGNGFQTLEYFELICMGRERIASWYFGFDGFMSVASIHGFLSNPLIVSNLTTISNKSTNQLHQYLRFITPPLNTAQHVSGILMSIIGSLSTAVAASGLPLEFGESSAVGRCRSNRTDNDQQHCYHHVLTVNQRLLRQLISS